MISFIVCSYMFVLVITLINGEVRTFYHQEMCYQKQLFNNCSSQISSPHANSCVVYNTPVCKNNEFPPWILEPVFKPKSESNTEFTIVIEPYAFYADELQKSNPVSAMNISITSFNKNISGFTIIMNRNNPSKNVCRIIDFRNSLDEIKIPFLFFYDCFAKLREDFWKNPLISFKAYPLNIELSYLVYIPRVSGRKSGSSCDWTPLLMIYHEGLSKNHIQLKFSNPQNDSNILFFVVTLLDSSDQEIDKTKIPSKIKNDMISCEFQSVKRGYYSVSVTLILAEKSCPVFKSDLFLVGIKTKDYFFEIFVALMIVLVALASVLIYYLCQRYLTSATSVLKPSLLLVYFHKQLHHEFLVMWAEYLEKHLGVKAYTLYKCGGNPKKWLEDVTSKSNIIVFVISEGLAQVFDEENSSYEEDHYWVEQLPEAKALINSLKIGEKLFCKICFPFSEKKHVPKFLKGKGHLFTLLDKVDETEEFLCHIFNCSSKFNLLNKLCCIRHHVIKNDSMLKDLKNLKDKLKEIKENQCDVVSSTNMNEKNLENIVNKQSDLVFQNNENINKMSENIIDEKQVILETDSSSIECKAFSPDKYEATSSTNGEENSLMSSSISIEGYENKNSEFRKQSDIVAHVNKEFLKYCICKALNLEI